MTGPSDFSDAELNWLVKIEKSGATLPREIEDKLVAAGVVNRTDLGLTTTGLGTLVLGDAQNIGRLPRDDAKRPKGPKG